jgi:hypothetical protein
LVPGNLGELFPPDDLGALPTWTLSSAWKSAGVKSRRSESRNLQGPQRHDGQAAISRQADQRESTRLVKPSSCRGRVSCRPGCAPTPCEAAASGRHQAPSGAAPGHEDVTERLGAGLPPRSCGFESRRPLRYGPGLLIRSCASNSVAVVRLLRSCAWAGGSG